MGVPQSHGAELHSSTGSRPLVGSKTPSEVVRGGKRKYSHWVNHGKAKKRTGPEGKQHAEGERERGEERRRRREGGGGGRAWQWDCRRATALSSAPASRQSLWPPSMRAQAAGTSSLELESSFEPGFLYASSFGPQNIPPLSSHQKAGLVRDQKTTYAPWTLKGSSVSMGPSCL